MKKIILILIAALPLLAQAQNEYSIKGRFSDDKKNGKIYMTYKIAGRSKIDSSIVTGGTFELKGTTPNVTRAYLQFIGSANASGKKTRPDMIGIYLEPTKMVINATDSLKRARITGSKVNDDEKQFNTLIEPLQKEMNALRNQYLAVTKSAPADMVQQHANLQMKMNNVSERRKVLFKEYVSKNPQSYISLFAIRDVAGPYMDQENGAELFASLSEDIKNSPDGKEMKNTLDGISRTAVGRMAPVFAQQDTIGKMIKLTDFRGKYVLVDFWASWCHPCRAENPNVLKAYNRFKDKGFTVVGISIDQEKMRDAWLKAIKDDGMPWTQLVDPKADPQGAAALYGVKAIPSNFLIDPQGKIVARNLRGDDLEKKIENILN